MREMVKAGFLYTTDAEAGNISMPHFIRKRKVCLLQGPG